MEKIPNVQRAYGKYWVSTCLFRTPVIQFSVSEVIIISFLCFLLKILGIYRNVTCMCVWKGVFFLFPFLDSGYRFVNTVLLHAFFHFIVYRGGSFVSAPEFFLLLFNTSVGMPVFPGGARGKESTCRSRRCKWHGLDPWVGKIPWSRKWQPTPVSCLESSMGRGTWQATIHGVSKSQTRLSTSGCHDLFNQFPTD